MLSLKASGWYAVVSLPSHRNQAKVWFLYLRIETKRRCGFFSFASRRFASKPSEETNRLASHAFFESKRSEGDGMRCGFFTFASKPSEKTSFYLINGTLVFFSLKAGKGAFALWFLWLVSKKPHQAFKESTNSWKWVPLLLFFETIKRG